MNGYELADEIKTMLADAESYYGEAESYLIKCEAMLRQQQAEIEALKLCCPKCGGVTGISEVLNHQVKELKIHEDIVYGLAYKHRIEKGDVQGFAMELLRKAQEK